MAMATLDVIALIGTWRFAGHRSVPEIHQRLQASTIQIAERTVLNVVQRYEELVTLHLTNQDRLKTLLTEQDPVILAIDGLQPDVGPRLCSGSFESASPAKSRSRVPCSGELIDPFA